MINPGEVLETAVNHLKEEGAVYLIEKRLYENRLIEHLKRLSADDRYMRFGQSIPDARIEHYVKEQIKTGDFVFTTFNVEGEITGMLHMAKDLHDAHAFEFGFSVLEEYRKTGIGGELFKKGLAFAKTLGAKRIYTYCLRENKAMQNLAKKNDLKVMLEHGDMTGELELKEKNTFETMQNLMDFAATEQLMILDTVSQSTVKQYLDMFDKISRVFGFSAFNKRLHSE